MKTMERVNIVEYHDGLAKSLAKMWNESGENWGGDAVVTTEQDVMDKEAKSTNLHTFLALVEEEVVGYCGLSEYREDIGALYIPLINVHPDYQGLKIGKQLLLTAIEKTVEYEWPRLDLFTWPGNTKAVPLYKKCGFFWEDRDDTTHLMNFMPMVLQIDWLRPFFEKHDWYTTSQRTIDIKPDGIKPNEHTFYEYRWEAGDEFVRIQFERTGRGIRLIETQDLLIEMELPDFKLLEKKNHAVKYRINNKTATPLNVSLTSNAAELVHHPLQESVNISDEWHGDFPFSITVPKSEPSPWKTHPVVGATIDIEGYIFPMNMGVFPIKAGKVEVRSVTKSWRAQQTGTLYLDLVSQLEEDSNWTIKLPENKVVKWETSEINTKVARKGRISVPLSVQLLQNGFLSEEVDVLVESENGASYTFTARLTQAFPGYGGKFGGDTDTHWYGYNGLTYVEVEKRNHLVKIGSMYSCEDPVVFFTPKIGKPYSEEFSKREASYVEYIELPEAFVIKTTLASEAFSPLLLHTYFKLYGEGLVEIKHEFVNDGLETKSSISLLQPVFMEFKSVAIPQQGHVMKGHEALIPFIEYIRDKDISEPWLFMKSMGETKGLAWSEDAVGKKDDWRFAVEYSIESIQPKENICLGPIQVGVNLSPNWQKWREFVLGDKAPNIMESSMFALEAEDGAFISKVGESVDYAFRSLLTPYVHGTLSVKNGGGTFIKEAGKEDEATKMNVQLTHREPGVKAISGQFRSPGQRAALNTYQLVQGTGNVQVVQGEDGWSVDNDIISMKACPDYYPGLYSLSYKGKETLHNQYPEAGPRAWWNPWGGGISYRFQAVSAYSMLKEETKIEPVMKIDQLGNQWTGICLSTSFTEHETFKGVTLRQYMLTLPEVPVLAVYAEIHQGSNRTFAKEKLLYDSFFNPAEKLTSSYVNVKTDGIFQKYYAGVEEYELHDTPSVTIGAVERKETMTVIHPTTRKMAGVYMNPEVFLIEAEYEWAAASGETTAVDPTILFFSEDNLPPAQHPFHGINFK
ncbi:GNAT family N-acetyltransferase [Pontibacillus yanchengensis]|uniref:GNAT family N-acetyltransferase n=2 Tax=Pontibacillus yanchengensis TaxID=462910 RepID=A0ACC7VJ95_9BACI|nr:GNAT family N-acetyltransferase [Pontibacillus yanchengensis]MYL34936.1 GNAT family N-acetyltransferase [Pontibacillus yanchengensis]MYL54690.1 GNAT family N-acetyltransferase [Pontibacillus yanchengensis]